MLFSDAAFGSELVLFLLCQLCDGDHPLSLLKGDQPYPLRASSLNGDIGSSQADNLPLVGDEH